MCGIAGIVTKDAADYETVVKAMVSKLRHRGPDGEAIRVCNDCIIGHTRLSIVDISGGNQPMTSRSGRYHIVFNGEIYGFQKIREMLSRKYEFQTHSDTEVILALIERYGHGFVSELPGMFSFAIWDSMERTLICGRDRFGEKPFYYAFGKRGEFIFASEIKSVLASDLITPALDRDSLSHVAQYLYVHPHKTIYSNVFVLRPGHQLTLRLGEMPKISSYWSIKRNQKENTMESSAGELRRLLEMSVDEQLVSDVPVGIYLSGGLDSRAILTCAARRNKSVKTFTFDLGSNEVDVSVARQIAQRFGTDHTEIDAKDYDVANVLQELNLVFDEPFADSSSVPTYLIAQLARKHVKVVLTGDGGDELLGGYAHWYRALDVMKKAPKGMARQFLRLAISAAKFKSGVDRHSWNSERGLLLRRRYATVAQAHAAQKQYFKDDELCSLGLETPSSSADERSLALDSVDDAMCEDAGNYMPGDILVKTDRTAMAHGLELRAPFLNHDLAQFCLDLPFEHKIDAETEKVVLQRAFARDWAGLPIIRKQGFGAPVTEWLKKSSVRGCVDKYLKNRNTKIAAMMPHEKILHYSDQNSYKTWILLILSMWLETHQFSDTRSSA
jgi:asparagine synthase (glutamine-hydrolysing)